MSTIRVNLISESQFTVQGHGVHTAFVEMRRGLENSSKVLLTVNAEPQRIADITHIHTIGSFALRRLISHFGGQKVVSAHIVPASLIGSIIGAKWWMPFFKLYLRWFYNRADRIIAVSPATRQDLLAMGVKTPISVLENSIDTTKYLTSTRQKATLRANLNLPTDKFIVVGNGQIQPRKKFTTFLKVARQLPDIQFVWIGGIPFKALGDDYLKLSRIMKRPPANLRITNVVPLSEASQYMRAADMMFMPSSQETFGLAIIEGAACGLPVLVRDIPDYDATFGQLVLRGDEQNFSQLITKLSKNRRFYNQYRTNSTKLAARYDSAKATERLLKIYRSILTKSGTTVKT
jgi:1,2-diacylglycerol-3-alpha-glucose alpha-1,2-galactosyltransferase